MYRYLILLIILSILFAKTSYCQQVSYVRTWNARVPQTDDKKIVVTSPVDSFLMSTQYLDALGRPLQTVSKQLSPLKLDVVSPFLYDSMGREKYKFIPFVANTTGGNASVSDGLYKTNPLQQQPVFYNSILSGQSESNLYSLNIFESSPLNRIRESYGPGKNWSGTASVVSESNRHGVDLRYGSNTNDDSVMLWQVTVGAIGSYSSYSSTLYSAGQLTKLISEDEHGGQILEFRDKLGNVVLKKVLVTASRDLGSGSHGHAGWLNTYYMYDDANNLRCVLQPEGLRIYSISPKTGPLVDSAILNQQCFRYEYDARKRMIIKKVPGKGREEMVYDKRDRLVMSRDSSLANKGYWLINKYDSLNRLVQNYLPLNSLSRAANQTNSDNNITYPAVNASDLMQQNYYDDYSWIPATPPPGISATIKTGDIIPSFFYTSYNISPEYAQAVTPDYVNVKGKLTGTKVRLFGTSTYLNSVIFYDDHGRVIQTQKANASGGDDQVTTQYDFEGRPLRVLHRQAKGGAVARYIRELTKYSYDHAGRITKINKQIGPSGVNVTIASNTYDELGRLKTKTYGANLESQTFDYNVRGWILGANRTYLTGSSSHYFGYELGYDNNQTYISGSTYPRPQYNGNICGTIWRSAGEQQVRDYDFSYDAANRLTAADFNEFTGGYFNKIAGLNFSVSGLTYDPNGNIRTMTQRGWKLNASAVIDSLFYTYQPSSNKLAKVTDSVNDASTKLGDFKDGTNGTSNDYTYDVNGNVISDKNKAITSILYTHLNTPYQITVPGKGSISYLFNNLGEKLKKTVVDNVTGKTTVWLYLDNFVYRNDTLQFFSTEEGRARYDTTQTTAEATAFNFDYFLKDHLGNVRMVLTDKKDTTAYYPLTFEDLQSTLQNQIWEDKTGASINITSARTSTTGNFGSASGNGSYSMLVRKSTGAIGAGKLLKVMGGDRIHALLDYYDTVANANNTGASGITSLVTNMASAITSSGQVTDALKSSATSIVSGLNTNPALISLLNTPNNTSGINNAPKAYLNVLFFDERFKLDSASSRVFPVPYSSGKGTINRSGATAMAVAKSGYAYIYFSNESDEFVYFDNFTITHEIGPIVEETHYYPFGLTMAGISSKALKFGMVENKYKFNGIEQNNEFDINMYDAFYRNLDPQTGRFWQINPQADVLESYSPYEAMGNNPISNVDPLGDFETQFGAWWHRLWHGGGSIKENEFGEWFVYKNKTTVSADGTPTVTGTPYYGKGRNQYSSAGEQRVMEDQLVNDGLFYRTSSRQEANDNNLRLFTGVLLPNVLKTGTIATNLPKLQQGENIIEKVKITFGKNTNQIYHTFRHTDEMGLLREAVQSAIKEHLPTVASQIVEGRPLNQVIEVSGRNVQYTAYKLSDGTINIGRIHAAN